MVLDHSGEGSFEVASDHSEDDPFESEWAWRAGALAGVVVALVMGLTMLVTPPAVLREGAVVSSLLTVAH